MIIFFDLLINLNVKVIFLEEGFLFHGSIDGMEGNEASVDGEEGEWARIFQTKAVRNLILKGERYEKSDFRTGINIHFGCGIGYGFRLAYT